MKENSFGCRLRLDNANGEAIESPRGKIAAMRDEEDGREVQLDSVECKKETGPAVIIQMEPGSVRSNALAFTADFAVERNSPDSISPLSPKVAVQPIPIFEEESDGQEIVEGQQRSVSAAN